jgi:hypothetical protein
MHMTAIEIMALLFVLFVTSKLIVLLIAPKFWVDKLVGRMWRLPTLISIGSLIIAAVALRYLLQTLTIVQIAGVAFFLAFLMALGFAPYAGEMVTVYCDKLSNKGEVLRRSWLAMIVWAAFVVWVLYALLAS